jgi:hypothetical protein
LGRGGASAFFGKGGKRKVLIRVRKSYSVVVGGPILSKVLKTLWYKSFSSTFQMFRIYHEIIFVRSNVCKRMKLKSFDFVTAMRNRKHANAEKKDVEA